MKKGRIITILTLTMVIGIGATAYAAGSTTGGTAPAQRLGLGRITSMRGYDYISNILKSKFGLTDAEISNSISSGKTLYDLAVEKGMTNDELKAELLEERTKAIDEAVSKGTITKEEGETLKANLNANIANCTGNFGSGQGQGCGQGYSKVGRQGRGMMGNGQGRFSNWKTN